MRIVQGPNVSAKVLKQVAKLVSIFAETAPASASSAMRPPAAAVGGHVETPGGGGGPLDFHGAMCEQGFVELLLQQIFDCREQMDASERQAKAQGEAGQSWDVHASNIEAVAQVLEFVLTLYPMS